MNEKVLGDPEPVIFISNLADSWIEVAIWPWIVAGRSKDMPPTESVPGQDALGSSGPETDQDSRDQPG